MNILAYLLIGIGIIFSTNTSYAFTYLNAEYSYEFNLPDEHPIAYTENEMGGINTSIATLDVDIVSKAGDIPNSQSEAQYLWDRQSVVFDFTNIGRELGNNRFGNDYFLVTGKKGKIAHYWLLIVNDGRYAEIYITYPLKNTQRVKPILQKIENSFSLATRL
jgi:hypothetical protein